MKALTLVAGAALLCSGCAFNLEAGTGWSWGRPAAQPAPIVVIQKRERPAPVVLPTFNP